MFEEKKKIESVLIHLAFGPVYHIFNKAEKISLVWLGG